MGQGRVQSLAMRQTFCPGRTMSLRRAVPTGGKGVSHKLFAGLFCLDRIGMHHLDELCIIYLYGLAARADSELCPHASSLLSCFDQHTG